MIKYGSDLTDKQDSFVRKLIDLVDNRAQREAEKNAARIAERAASEDCPTGRFKITGDVMSTKSVDSQYGYVFKMLVRDDRGFKVFGSIPSCLELFDDKDGNQRALAIGDRVEFMAAIEQSKDDVKFGFYKRPTKAKLL